MSEERALVSTDAEEARGPALDGGGVRLYLQRMVKKTDWITVTALAGLAIVFNVGFHEGIHGLTTLVVGARLRTYSALYVDSITTVDWQMRVIAGSASIANILAGIALWLVLRGTRKGSLSGRWFLWLVMLMNLLYGAGYWMFSGAAGVGDWATVIAGWSGQAEWRIGMFVVGSVLFMFFVWLSLRVFGSIAAPAPGTAAVSYATSAAVIALAGVFNPFGMGSLPVTAGLAAALGALSPLLWMMSWFRAKMFAKTATEHLTIPRSWPVIVCTVAALFFFCFILGRGISAAG